MTAQEKLDGLYYAHCTCGWTRLGYGLVAVTEAAQAHAQAQTGSAPSHRIVISR